jgi:hypothetical protein
MKNNFSKSKTNPVGIDVFRWNKLSKFEKNLPLIKIDTFILNLETLKLKN